MAKMADCWLVCMGGRWHVWGPAKRLPDPGEVEKAESALRKLWKERCAVPAYNYASYDGHLTYVPWCGWRAGMKPTLDSPCFRENLAEFDRLIHGSPGKHAGEEEEGME